MGLLPVQLEMRPEADPGPRWGWEMGWRQHTTGSCRSTAESRLPGGAGHLLRAVVRVAGMEVSSTLGVGSGAHSAGQGLCSDLFAFCTRLQGTQDA